MRSIFTRHASPLIASGCGIAFLVLSLLLTGCGTVTERQSTLSDTDCGPVPERAVYQDQIETAVRAYIHDADSATFDFSEPYKVHYQEPGKSGWQYGWCVKTKVNSRNGFGGFAGVEPYWSFFHQGHTMVMIKPTEVAKANWSDQNPFDSPKYLQKTD